VIVIQLIRKSACVMEPKGHHCDHKSPILSQFTT